MDSAALIRSHEPLARNHARAMARRNGHLRRHLPDMEQDAREALVFAATRFDPTLGFAFATYARRVVITYLCRRVRCYLEPVSRETTAPQTPSDFHLREAVVELGRFKTFAEDRWTKPHGFQHRWGIFLRRILTDDTYEQIAGELLLTKQRVHQIDREMRQLLAEFRGEGRDA